MHNIQFYDIDNQSGSARNDLLNYTGNLENINVHNTTPLIEYFITNTILSKLLVNEVFGKSVINDGVTNISDISINDISLSLMNFNLNDNMKLNDTIKRYNNEHIDVDSFSSIFDDFYSSKLSDYLNIELINNIIKEEFFLRKQLFIKDKIKEIIDTEYINTYLFNIKGYNND